MQNVPSTSPSLAAPATSDQRFELGSIIVTPEVLQALRRSAVDLNAVLERHAACDWSALHSLDRERNERALQSGGRLISIFTLFSEHEEPTLYQTLWVVTSEDRLFTTLLLQDDNWREMPR